VRVMDKELMKKCRLTDGEVCDVLNRSHKTGQIYFMPIRLKEYLPYYDEIKRLLDENLTKAIPFIAEEIKRELEEYLLQGSYAQLVLTESWREFWKQR